MEQTVKTMTASPYGFQKIGVFGGSYNPVHCGHLQIAEAAREQFGLDQVWFVPAWIQPFKQGMQVVSASHRRQMLELALEPYPDFRICDYELEKKGISYTCDTIQALKAAMPDTHLYFIMGADSLDTFGTWYHPEKICACASILAAVRHRPGKSDELQRQADILRQSLNADIHFLQTPFYNISSTQIRQMDPKALAGQHLVPRSVLQYICDHHLYEEGVQANE